MEDIKYNEWILDKSVDIGYLSDWYINSVCDTDNPIWTDEHISELIGDFYCIPKQKKQLTNYWRQKK